MTSELKKREETERTGQASAIRDLLVKAQAEIPNGYKAGYEGISYAGSMKICSLFRIVGETKSSSGQDWGKLFEIVTPDKKIIQVIVPRKELVSRPSDAIGRLSFYGLKTFVENKIIIELIRKWDADEIIVSLDRAGWTNDYSSFAFIDGRIVLSKNTQSSVVLKDPEEDRTRGSLAGWQQGIGAACIGNPYMLFVVSTAFCGPLLTRCGVTPGMFHLHGKSSIGKSTLLSTAISVWTYYETPPSWYATSNGLEALLYRANNGLHVLDELTKHTPEHFDDDVYMIANGAGKARATKIGDLQDRRSWSVTVLSSGEKGSHEVLEKAFGKIRGGQKVRLIDIHVKDYSESGNKGAFSNFHGSPSGAAFSKRIKKETALNAGHAAKAFVKAIINNPDDDFQTYFNNFHKSFLEALGDQLSDKGKNFDFFDGQTERVLSLFALSAFAGEWATKLGITGWEANQAKSACLLIARRWFEESNKPSEGQIESVDAIRGYLNKLPAPLEAPDKKTVLIKPESVWADRDFFYIDHSEILQIFPDSGFRKLALYHIRNSGYLVVGSEKDDPRFRIMIEGDRKRLYRIRQSIMAS